MRKTSRGTASGNQQAIGRKAARDGIKTGKTTAELAIAYSMITTNRWRLCGVYPA